MALGTSVGVTPDRRRMSIVAGAGVAGALTALVDAWFGAFVLGALALWALVRLVDAVGASPDGADRQRLLRWTLFAFGAHLAFALAVMTNADLLRYLATDAAGYHDLGRQLAESWRHGTPGPELTSGKEGFYYLVASVYWLFGPHMAAGLVVNAFFSAALVPIVTDTTRRLFGAAPAHHAAPLVVAIPALFLWGSPLLKEALAFVLIAVVMNCGVRLTRRMTAPSLLLLAAALAVLLSVRSFVAFTVGAGVAFGIALSRRNLLRGAVTAAAVVVAAAVIVTASGIGSGGQQTVAQTDLQRANLLRRGLAETGSGFAEDVDISTPEGAAGFVSSAVTHFLLGPFPWQLTGSRQAPAVIDVFAWWALLPSLVRGLRFGARRAGRTILPVLLGTAATVVLLSLAVGNFGTLLRERAQVIVMVIPFVALGIAVRRRAPAPVGP